MPADRAGLNKEACSSTRCMTSKKLIPMRKILIAASLLMSYGAIAQTGAYNEQAAAYIRQYKDLAIAEQQRSGVPAAITLAQGIHETQAGTSELATEANNHFGIKCKREWTGETYAHTDDAPNECFRKYTKAYDSYRDHSDYLRSNKRYQSCFALSITDYAAWAAELKRCGYATNPRYAQKLIRIVEDFHLQDYTYAGLGNGKAAEPVYVASAEPMREQQSSVKEQPGEIVPDREVVHESAASVSGPSTPVAIVEEVPYEEPVPVYGQTMQRNGLKGFYARKGDVLLESAIKYNVRYARILEINDLPDAPLEGDMFVYLEKKHSTGQRRTHRVKEGETMIMVAQAEGIQLKTLRSLNQIDVDEEPLAGSTLQLQNGVSAKPAVRRRDRSVATNTYQRNRITEDNAVPVAHKPAERAVEAVPVPVREEQLAPRSSRANEVVKAEPEPVAVANQEPVEEEVKEDAPVAKEVVAAVREERPVIAEEKPVVQPVVKNEQPAPRRQPRPQGPPAKKTYTIADELAVGEETNNQKYSPRYVPKEEQPAQVDPNAPLPPSAYTAKPLTEEPPLMKRQAAPVTQEAAPVKQEPVVREEDLPQDEFSRLKRQLDKAVYGTKTKSSSNVVVIEERPAPGREVADAAPVMDAPAPAVATVANNNATYHIVKTGETAFGIAKQYGISMKALREMNGLNFEAIKVGQKLRVK